VLFYRLIWPAAPKAAWWITLLVFLLGPIRSETGNGMEMSLLCLLVLGIMVLLRDDDGRRWKAVAVLAALVLVVKVLLAGLVALNLVAMLLAVVAVLLLLGGMQPLP
jgi:hypothetical protein